MKTVPANRLSKRISTAYIRKMMKLKNQMSKAVEKQMLPLLKGLFPKQKQDKAPFPFLSFPSSMEAKLFKISAISNKIERHFAGPIVERYIKKAAGTSIRTLSETNANKMKRTFMRITGVDINSTIISEGLESFIDEKITEHVGLIKNASSDYMKHVNTVIQESLREGTPFKEVQNKLFGGKKSADSAIRNRIRVIAVDQMQTINAELNKYRTERLGITEGVWRTAKDKRVRTIHEELQNQRFNLQQGAWLESESRFLFPGITDIYCRCDFAPVIPQEFFE